MPTACVNGCCVIAGAQLGAGASELPSAFACRRHDGRVPPPIIVGSHLVSDYMIRRPPWRMHPVARDGPAGMPPRHAPMTGSPLALAATAKAAS